jgi:Holliday junction resolvase RusA-like endonuclease
VTTIEFVAYGQPQTKGSARGFAMKIKGTNKYRAVITNDNKRTKGWEQAVRDAAVAAAAGKFYADGALTVNILFGLVRPKSVKPSKRPMPCVKPDIDKLARSVLDGMTGAIFSDDAQVCRLTCEKKYVDGATFAQVTVSEVCE